MSQGKFGEMSNYAYLRQALCKAYPALNNLGQNSLFQFVATPMDADWETGDEFSLYDMMDTVPAERNGYYIPGTSRVSTAYEDLLDHISKNNCYNNSDWQRMNRDLEAQRSLVNGLRANLEVEYKKAKRVTTVDEDAFIEWAMKQQGPFGNPKAATYVTEYNKCAKYENALEQQEKDINAPILRLKSDYTNSLVEYTAKNGTFSLPAYNVIGDLAKLQSDWAKRGDNEYQEVVSISTREEIKEPWVSTYSAMAESVWFLAHAHAKSDLTQTIADTKYKMTLKLKGISTFDVSRPKWFKDSYVDPHMELAKGMALDKKSFYGEKGSLHLIPTSFLVIYHPTIELEINKDVYETKIKTQTYANNLLSIFGLGFGIRGSIDKHLVSKGDSCTLRFDPPADDRPKIIGVTSVKKYL